MATENTSTDVVVVRLEIQEGGASGKTTEKAKKDVEALATSILGLQQANKKLREERNKLDTSTEEGRKKIKDLNDIIDENTEIIKQNSSALEKQRFNIGNYGSALDKLMPSVSNAIKGVQGMYKEFMTFVTTFSPWIVGLTAIVAILTGLFKAYAKSAQGARDLEVAQGALERTGQRLLNTFGSLVESIIGEGGITRSLQSILTQISPLIGYYYQLSVAVEKNAQAFERQKAAADGASKFYQELAELNKRTAEDDKKSAAERIAAAQRVIELLEAGAAKRREVMEARIKELGRLETKTQENVTEIANLRKELDDLGEETTGKISPILSMIQAIQDEYAQKQIDNLKEHNEELVKLAEEAREIRIAILERELEHEHYIYEQRLEFEKEFRLNQEKEIDKATSKGIERVDKLLAEQRRRKEVADKKANDAAKKNREDDVKGQEAAVNAGTELLREAFGRTKAFAIADAIIRTIQGVVRALAEYPYPYSAIVGALVGATGAVQVARIGSTNFRQGGQAWGTWGPKMAKGGYFNLGGNRHEQGGTKFIGSDGTRFEAEKDEGIFVMKREANKEYLSSLNQKHGGKSWTTGAFPSMQKFAQGGQFVTSQPQQTQLDMTRAVRDAFESFPPIITLVEDVNSAQAIAASTQQRAQVI